MEGTFSKLSIPIPVSVGFEILLKVNAYVKIIAYQFIERTAIMQVDMYLYS